MSVKQVLSKSVPGWTGLAIVAATLVFWHALVIHGKAEIKRLT